MQHLSCDFCDKCYNCVMSLPKTNQVRLEELNFKRLKSLAKSNRLGLRLAKLANLAVEKGLPELVKELAR